MAETKAKKRILNKEAALMLNKNMAVISKNVKFYRKKMGLTQHELAFYLLTDRKTILRIENHQDYNPELLTLVKISHILQVNLYDLFAITTN